MVKRQIFSCEIFDDRYIVYSKDHDNHDVDKDNCGSCVIGKKFSPNVKIILY